MARGVVARSIAVVALILLLWPPPTAGDKYHPLIQRLRMINRRGKPHVRAGPGFCGHAR